MKKHHTKKAFTLIEVLIAATIFAVVMVMVVAIFSWASSYNAKLREMRNVNQDARKIMSMISDDIRQANGGVKITNGVTSEIVGEFAIIDFSSTATNYVDKSYQSVLSTDIDLDSSYNNALLVVDKKENKCRLYAENTNNEIVRAEIAIDSNGEITDNSLTPSAPAIINSPGTDIKLGFAGFTPLLDSTRSAQPFIKIKMLTETEDYDSVQANYRTKMNLETTVTSRDYNIFEEE